MKDISLFEHNEEAYIDLVNSLEDNNLSFIERATGTGKSYILIKYLATMMKNKRVLIVTTHEPMFNQLVNRDMEKLGVSKDLFEKIDLSLYASLPKKSAEWYYDNYDCIIFDEAHHCGASVWGETVREIRDLFAASEDKKMIGATATGTRYLDNYMNVAEEFFDNNVASTLSLSEAILREILPAPIYVNIMMSLKDNISSLKSKIRRLGNPEELKDILDELKQLETQIDLEQDKNKLFKEYDVKNGEKYVVFCRNVKDLEKIKKEATKWFEGLGEVEMYEAHSYLTKKQNQEAIDEFSKPNDNKIKLMFAVDMFNEGMHISGVDGVIMCRPTTSPIVYLQQIGRALSFSARKNQIKIFDLVGNATDIDVIHNIYKDLLYKSNEMIKADSNNKEHYERVIERFKIVEKGNDIVSRLDEISELLDHNYVLKQRINNQIEILEEYSRLHNSDFMKKYQMNKVDLVYKKAYEELCKYIEDLSIEQIERLNKINIIVAPWQKDETIIQDIIKNGSYKKAIANRLEKYVEDYNNFFLENGRRPNVNNKEEKELVINYYKTLTTYNKNKLKRLLASCNYKLNIEELLLTGAFPQYSDIIELINSLNKKYLEGIELNSLEVKLIKIANKLIQLDNYYPSLVASIYNKTIKIDEAINIIEEYVSLYDYPVNKESLQKNTEVFNAYKLIKRYYKDVTKLQFKKLNYLEIELPEELDYTYDEFVEILGDYKSIRDKEEKEAKSSYRIVENFINKNKVRPTKGNCSKEEYEAYIKVINSNNYMSFCRLLSENNIELSIYEKGLINNHLTVDEIEEILKEVVSELKACDKDTYSFKLIEKKIKIIQNNSFIDNKLISILNRTNNVINKVFETLDNGNKKQFYLDSFIWSNKDVIPFNLLKYIRDCNVNIPTALYIMINKTNSINIGYDKYKERMNQYQLYMNYIKENGKRPDDSYLNSYINDYLLSSSKRDRRIFIKILNDHGVPVHLEELFIADDLTKDDEDSLYEILKEKTEKGDSLSSVEKFSYEILRINRILSTNIGLSNSTINKSIQETKKETEKEILTYIKELIRKDPMKKLDFEKEFSIITKKEKEELATFRLSIISKDFINKIKEIMKKEEKTLDEILNEEDKKTYDDIKIHSSSDRLIKTMIEEVEEINKKNSLKKNKINVNEEISRYLEFISKNGRIPDIKSTYIEEIEIAKRIEMLSGILTNEEYTKIIKMGKNQLDKMVKENFFEEYINFIKTNKRVPSVLSDDSHEIDLAKRYQGGIKLNSEQKKEITILSNKYRMNTLDYYKRKKGL